MASSRSALVRLLRDDYFVVISIVMLLLMVLGFARTFFLRPLFVTYEVPGYAFIHGALMSLWFVWFSMQTVLVARGKVRNHRRWGPAGVAIGALASLSAVGVALAVVIRERRGGRDVLAELEHFADVVWSNLSSVLVFSAFLWLAVLLRGRPEAHKRLMLLATIALMGPALVRVWVLPPLEVWPGMDVNTLVFAHLVMWSLPASLVLHDLVTGRRLHATTLWGVPTLVLGLAFFQQVVPRTGVGQLLIRILGDP